METRQRIRTFIAALLNEKGDAGKVGDTDSLLLSGRLQSIDAVEIALFLEREFGIDFAEIGFDETQIDSIERIASLVARTGRDFPDMLVRG